MRFPLALLLLAGTAVAAPVPKDFKRVDDATALVGTWKAHRLTMHGKDDAVIQTHTFGFDADGKCHTLFGQGQRSDWTFTLDAKATPKRMKWTNTQGNSAFDCVYELAGDTFKLGFLAAGQLVPDKVEPGPSVTLYEMTRAKDAR